MLNTLILNTTYDSQEYTMSILTKNEILKKINNKEIIIEPFDKEAVGPGSVDLTLDNKFRVFKKTSAILDVNDDADYQKITDLIESWSIVIMPGETILGITKETVTLPTNMCGWLEGRSRYARLGLMVHISASFMQPGLSNKQVLEMTNMSSVPLKLHAGTKICQFIFQETIGNAEYKGRFSKQTAP